MLTRSSQRRKYKVNILLCLKMLIAALPETICALFPLNNSRT